MNDYDGTICARCGEYQHDCLCPPIDREFVERQVIGALRSAVKAHGAIHLSNLSSAAKRITGQLMVALTDGPSEQSGDGREAASRARSKREEESSSRARGREGKAAQ